MKTIALSVAGYIQRCNTGMDVVLVTDSFLIGLKPPPPAPQKERSAEYSKYSQEPRGEPTTIILLNGHSLSIYYPWIIFPLSMEMQINAYKLMNG